MTRKAFFAILFVMIQQPKNYHLLSDFKSFPNIFESGKIFCAFDTETTGCGAEKERVIEIGAIKFSSDGILDEFCTLLYPEKPLPPIITGITGITDEMLADAPLAKEMVPRFLDFCKNTILVAHNAPFDLQFINHELIRLNLDTIQNHAIDTLRLTRWAYPDFEHWNQPFLAEKLGIEVKHAHRAKDDARVCSEIFIKTLVGIKQGSLPPADPQKTKILPPQSE